MSVILTICLSATIGTTYAMSLRKIILIILLVIPILLTTSLLLQPISASDQHNGIELFYLVIGLPIIFLNYLEWFAPKVLDEFLGQPQKMPSDSTVNANDNSTEITPGRQPDWKLFIVIASILFLGITIGVGAVSSLNQFKNQTAPQSFMTQEAGNLPARGSNRGSDTATITPSATLDAANTEETPNPTIGEDPNASPGSQDGTATPGTATSRQTVTPGTQSTNGCIEAGQVQIDIITAGIDLVDNANFIQNGFLFKSSLAEDLWFFAAPIYGPGFESGASEPAIWAFFGDINNPIDVYSINDIALQYSGFPIGQLATPVLDVQSDGAPQAFTCVQELQ